MRGLLYNVSVDPFRAFRPLVVLYDRCTTSANISIPHAHSEIQTPLRDYDPRGIDVQTPTLRIVDILFEQNRLFRTSRVNSNRSSLLIQLHSLDAVYCRSILEPGEYKWRALVASQNRHQMPPLGRLWTIPRTQVTLMALDIILRTTLC